MSLSSLMFNNNQYNRRKFIKDSSSIGASFIAGGFIFGHKVPRVMFCGAAQQVSGSCHLLETHYGDFLIDCGSFFPEMEGMAKDSNTTFNYFDPSKIKAVFLTHAHIDHIGKLPLLYFKGFRGPIFCTDCTRDLAAAMYAISGGHDSQELESSIISVEEVASLLDLFVPVPYEQVCSEKNLTFRFTEAGHILGSAMVEIWVSGRKFIFSGDMGPDYAPLTRLPHQHEEADFVLVESTYGATPKQAADFRDFGRKIASVIDRGGDVLLPSFVLHKTQSLIFIIHQLKQEKIIPAKVPVICDSTSAHRINHVYNTYSSYFKKNVIYQNATFNKGGLMELSSQKSFDFKKENQNPVIYISASGMLDHANAPKHLALMAENKNNAVFIVGWQSPTSLGTKVLDPMARANGISLPVFNPNTHETEMVNKQINLEVSKWGPGFSSHASGQQILEWIGGFKRIGSVCVVHGEKSKALLLAEKIREMGVESIAPTLGQVIKAYPRGVSPKEPPKLKANSISTFAPTDK